MCPFAALTNALAINWRNFSNAVIVRAEAAFSWYRESCLYGCEDTAAMSGARGMVPFLVPALVPMLALSVGEVRDGLVPKCGAG